MVQQIGVISFCKMRSCILHFTVTRSLRSFQDYTSYVTLRKIPQFHLISWSGNFAERHRFCDSPETLRKLYFSTKFPHQEIRRNLRCFKKCKALTLTRTWVWEIPHLENLYVQHFPNLLLCWKDFEAYLRNYSFLRITHFEELLISSYVQASVPNFST